MGGGSSKTGAAQVQQSKEHVEVPEVDRTETPTPVSHPPEDGDPLHQAHVAEAVRTQTPVSHPPEDGDPLHQAHVAEVARTQTPVPHPPDDCDPLHQGHVGLPDVARTQTPVPHPPDDGSDVLHDCQKLTSEVIYTTEEAQAVESLEDIQLFAEFPTPELLRGANKQYAKLKKPVEYDSEGVVEPYPVASRKQSVVDLEKHQDLDLHCVQAPETLLHKPLQSLVDYLVWPAKSDVQKARALFCWLTAQNLATLDVSSAVDDTVLSYLKRLKNNQPYYSALYLEMCQLAGLKCCKVEGYVKPGDEPGDHHGHSWSAVLLDHIWRLVDPHWGSCHVTGGGNKEWELTDNHGNRPEPNESATQEQLHQPPVLGYARNEFYFLPNPEEFIYTHLPNDDKWQLLARPVTVQEFQEMVYLKPPFFDLNLRLLDHRRCIQYASDGEIEIQVGLPQKKRRFLYQLWISTAGKDDQSNMLSEVGLDRFVFMEYDEDFVNFRVVFPIAGKFKLELFSRADTCDDFNAYDLVCSYIIFCDDPKQDCKPMPENTRREWGPGPDMEVAGLKPITHKKGLVECANGTVEMKFKQERDVKVLAKLQSNSLSQEALGNYTLSHKEGEEIVFNIKLPEAGDYALNLYAKDADEKGPYPSVCTYLLTSETAAFDTTPFPSILNGTLGPTAENKDLSVQLMSPSTPLIQAGQIEEVEVVLRTSKPTFFLSKLVYQSGKEEVNMDNMCFRTTEGSHTTFKIRCPQAGMYAFVVYGKRKEDEGDLFLRIYKFLLKVSNPKQNCLPFPIIYHTWDDGCKLLAPETGLLSGNQTVPVAVQIPDAKDVAVIVGDKWFHLKKWEDEAWRGEVQTGAERELMLGALVTEESATIYTLFATFQVKDKQALAKEKEKQEEARKKAQKKAKLQAERKKKREAELMSARTDLQKAKADRDIKRLRRALRIVEQKRFVTSMQQLVTQSRELLQSLQRIEKLRVSILKMDAKTMLEIRRYASPPPLVHEVMVAALLLLGDNEELTREWTECQKLCNSIGPTGLNKRVMDFKVDRLHPEIAARAKQILQKWRVDDVKAKSAGAGTFYIWTIGMINELHTLQKKSKKALPAGIPRQKEILLKNG